jgi:hypothetical protein
MIVYGKLNRMENEEALAYFEPLSRDLLGQAEESHNPDSGPPVSGPGRAGM